VDDEPPEIAAEKAKNAPPPPKPAVALGDPLTSLQKRAEGGDVPAMLALGRAHEAIVGESHRAEAKKWYEKAAAAGDPSAKEALRMMDAQVAATTRAAAEAEAEAARIAAKAMANANARGTASTQSTAGASTPGTTAPSANVGPVSWNEIVGSIDTKDFVTVSRPGYQKTPSDKPMFIGLTTAPDKTLTVAASGPTGETIDACSIVLRVRNRQDIGRNDRVAQAAAVAGVLTRGNVALKDMSDWISNYLMTGAASDLVFRNGWSIKVSGTNAEGMRDPKAHLGEAVLVEMKK
jgi:hypothetical protein